MPKYKLSLAKPHAESMIELINNDNAATIVTPLTLADYNLIKLRPTVSGDNLTAPRTHAVTVQNKKVLTDTVELFFNKIQITDIVTMTSEGGDFDWYDPDTWDEATSPAKAVAAFKLASERNDIVCDALYGAEIKCTRTHNQTSNHFELTFDFTSHVVLSGAKFELPKHFSETITVTDLVGFVYQPIAPESVIA